MEIPVAGSKDYFVWGLWVSVSKANYDRIGELWNTQLREHELPLSATLCSDIPLYGRTTDLKCALHLRNAGRRPSIILEPTDHPLSLEQRSGITIERVKEIAAVVQRHAK